MDIKVSFGLRVRELRKSKGISQEGIAFDADIDRTYMNSVENGKRNISLKNIEKILKALDVSFSEFFNSNYFQGMK
jgi:transcriptional regulator with XRE-family HTH domain